MVLRMIENVMYTSCTYIAIVRSNINTLLCSYHSDLSKNEVMLKIIHT